MSKQLTDVPVFSKSPFSAPTVCIQTTQGVRACVC